MQWSRRSISSTSFSSRWVRARDSNADVDLAVGRPIVPAHTGRGYRAESRTFDRRVADIDAPGDNPPKGEPSPALQRHLKPSGVSSPSFISTLTNHQPAHWRA